MSKFRGHGCVINLRLSVIVAIFVIVLVTGKLIGQTSGTSSPSANPRDNSSASPGQMSPPQYRRVYIPEEAVSTVLPMKGTHFPIPADEFHRLMDMPQKSDQHDRERDSRPVFDSLKLAAQLDNQQQLVYGKGIMRIGNGDTVRRQDALSGSTTSLSPFRLPISNSVWSIDEPARLGLDKSGETVLFIPTGAGTLTFDWTLRGETSARNELVFSMELPQFLRTELILDLPENKKPIVPFGFVQQVESPTSPEFTTESDIPPDYRRWQIAMNGNQAIRLTIAPDEKSEKFSRSIGVYERHFYDLSLFGMQLETRFFLEKSDFDLNELTLELDNPLSLLSVKVDDRVLPWSEISAEDDSVTRFLVSIPYMESSILRIQVLTFCPIQIDSLWNLPRVHIRSPLFFWTETRNSVRVNRPLLTQRIRTPQQRQETPILRLAPPSPGVEETESDLFVFQAFSEDSPLGIELGLKQTQLNVESGTSIQWGEREINARTILDLTVVEGQVQQLELDVAADWTIDLIESTDPTRVANYFVEDTKQEIGDESSSYARWIVPFRRVVDPAQVIRLVVQLRRPMTTSELLSSSEPTQNHRYPLSDFMPIRVPGSREGQQLIVFEPGRQYRMFADDRQDGSASSPTPEHIRKYFDETPSGTVFIVEDSPQRYFLEIESLKPTYGMAAVTNLVLQGGILWETCRFSCTPAENTPVDRLKIRFSQGDPSRDTADWSWKLEQNPETSRQLKVVPIGSRDSVSTVSGEIRELELPAPQSEPFVVTASRVIPFDTHQAIPLPFFPDLSGVDAFVHIETRDTTLFRMSQHLLKPVSPPYPNEMPANRSALTNHTLRGVYQYSADDDAFVPENAILVLEPVPISDPTRGDSANIWSLALHSHYLPQGDVVSYAVMTLENRTLDRLKIGLPAGITNDDIRNLWIDREKTSWSFAPGNGDSGVGGNGGDLFVTLPLQRRYLTVMLEYIGQGDKLSDSSRLRPVMPTFDMPIFTRKWYAWYPPQYRSFDVSATDGKMENRTFVQSRNEHTIGDPGFRLPFFDRSYAEFDLFSSHNMLLKTISTSAKTDIKACSLRLLNLLDDPELEQRIRRPAATRVASETTPLDSLPGSSPQGREETVLVLTWGELFASGVMEDVLSRDEGSQNHGRYFTILIDGDALAQVGVFPSTPVIPEIPTFANAETLQPLAVGGTIAGREKGMELMERNHLAVIFDGHRNLLVTSVLAAAKLRSQLVPVYADHFWYYPYGNINGFVPRKNATESVIFPTPHTWQNQSQENLSPVFSFGTPGYFGTDRPGWAVREILCDGEFSPAILLIRHDTLQTGKLLVFFIIVLVAWRIRPDRLTWVILPPVVAVFLAGLLPPNIACLVPGMFWGMVCAVAIAWIRRLQSHHRMLPHSLDSDRTTVVSSHDRDDDSEPGEVRRIVVISRPPVGQQDSNVFPTRDIPTTDMDPASKSVFLTFLGVTICGLLFAGTGALLAQTASQPLSSPEFFPLTIPQGQSPSGSTSDVSGNVPDRFRGMTDTRGVTPYEVWIPYDPQGRIGNQYYLPDSLYFRLLQGNDRETTISGNWRIRKARYVGTLAHNPIQNEVSLSQFRVFYDVELADASAVVRLPEMPVIPDEIRCDGQLLKPVSAMEIGRNEYAITISGRGNHQLEVPLQPTILGGNPEMTLHRFEFAIPPVPDSTLELTLPVANLPVEVLHSFGQLSRLPDKLSASLGPVKRLSVSWPVSPPPPGHLRVSQYFRLSVAPLSLSPSSVVLEQTKLHTLFRFTVSGGSVKQIQLAIDPRYRLEGGFRSSEIMESEPVVDEENRVQITFMQPVTKNVTVEAVFVPKSISGLVDFSGIGTLPLPRFSVTNDDVRIVHSWLGVSSAPSTQLELPLSNVEIRMFENAWGGSGEPVHHAYDLQRLQENWFLTIKNRLVFRRIDQRQWLQFRNQSIQTYLEESVTPSYDKASLSTDPTADSSLLPETIQTFFHEMILPEGFRLETVEVKTSNGNRWEKMRIEQKGRHLVLFFKEPVVGKYTLSVFGTIPSESDEAILFPLFTHDEQVTVQRSIFCSRDSSVLVRLPLDDQSIQTVADIPCPMPTFPSGNFLSAFRIESPEQFFSATVSMSPNNPEITGVMVSRIERDYPFTHWNMIVTCDVTITRGELDQFSLFVPLPFSETLTAFHYDSRLTSISIPPMTKNDGTLIQIKLREPLSGKQSFEFQFPLGGTLDAVSVPYVRLQHDEEIEHFVALPENSGEKPLVWSLTNLAPTNDVPPVLPLQQRGPNTPAALIDMALNYRYYRVGQRDFSARISSSNEAAFVSCHDVAFFVKRNGLCFVVSVFDIQGNNNSPYCDIAFPAEYQLLQMQRNDVFPLPERRDNATIRVELLSDIPVQRLTMVYCMQWDTAGFAKAPPPATGKHLSGERQSWPLSLVFPQILSLPVHQTLWEVWYEPPSAIDTQIDARVNVWNGRERFFSEHEMNTLAQSDARNLQVRIELARLTQTLALVRLMPVPSQNTEKYPVWSRFWNGISRRAVRLLPEWNQDKDSWDKTFLHGNAIVPQDFDPFTPEWEAWETSRDFDWMDAWISRDKTPQVVYDELVNQYQTLIGRTPPSLSPGERDVIADTQETREHYLSMMRFPDDFIGLRYLAGAASCGITDLTLVFHSQNDSVPFGVYLHYILWGTVGLVLFAMTVHGNIRRFFQRFSILFAIALIVFCWMFVQPNGIGWMILIILLISAVRIQWDQMHAATTVTRNQSQ